MYAAPKRTDSGPSLGATFYPGRDDDFSLPIDPEVVSPAPQRVMPEVPVQIAGSLEHLELEANSVSRNPNIRQPGPGSRVEPQQARVYSGSYSIASSRQSHDYRDSYGYQQSIPAPTTEDYPSYGQYPTQEEHAYSPFPRLVNPGPNVPPSFEDKEVSVEQARVEVLSSNDPELQLTWAYDALNFVEISLAYLARTSPEDQRPDTPELEHQIKTDAINVVSFLADQHHPRAEFMRGNWLEFGKFGFRTDKKEAFKCYSRSAERGYARAEYRMGMQFENSSEPMKAIKHYTQGAALGDSASNYRLGMMTLLGQHGQRQDYARGVRLIQLAAQTADENAPQGAYVYGMLLARELPGISVPEMFLPLDIKLAREMIEKAAYLGFARAQLKMGMAYELCQLGCEFNPALSLHYNRLAAKQGEPEAEMAISKWLLVGHEGVFEKNEELAFLYAQRAAENGLATAEFALGYFYEIGMYVQVDLQLAKSWYAKAAAHGNKDASNRIEGISRSKTLSKRDHENIALSAIRARHASQRSKTNPVTERQRAAAAASQMPPVSEAVDMPNPVIPHDYPPPVPPVPSQHQFPARSSSKSGAGAGFINPNILAGAAQPPGGGYLQPQYGPRSPPRNATTPYPVSRPGSANGNTPFPPHSNSATGFTGPRPQGPILPPAGVYPPPNAGPGPQRPLTTVPPGQRLPPGPGRMQHANTMGGPGAYPGFEGDGQPMRNPGTRPLSGSGPGLAKPPIPAVNLGFEAPEPRKPAPTPKPVPQARPPHQSPPLVATQPPPIQPMSPKPPMPPAQIPRPPTAQPAQSTAQKAGGKGPKTFEEMGVAEMKKDEECVIM